MAKIDKPDFSQRLKNEKILDYILQYYDGSDRETQRQMAIETRRFASGNTANRDAQRREQESQTRWYDSLKNGEPDYSIYADPVYIGEAWVCFCVYSKGYIRNLPRVIPQVNSIVDVGCGVGLTTAFLKSIFKPTWIYGTQVKGFQHDVATQVGKDFDFPVVESPIHWKEMGKADMVFASEYFEHFEAPVQHLDYIVSQVDPTYVVCANAFSSKSVGHFPQYKFPPAGSLIPTGIYATNKQAGRVFNKAMRQRKYRKVETGFFNSRPMIWKKER